MGLAGIAQGLGNVNNLGTSMLEGEAAGLELINKKRQMTQPVPLGQPYHGVVSMMNPDGSVQHILPPKEYQDYIAKQNKFQQDLDLLRADPELWKKLHPDLAGRGNLYGAQAETQKHLQDLYDTRGDVLQQNADTRQAYTEGKTARENMIVTPRMKVLEAQANQYMANGDLARARTTLAEYQQESEIANAERIKSATQLNQATAAGRVALLPYQQQNLQAGTELKQAQTKTVDAERDVRVRNLEATGRVAEARVKSIMQQLEHAKEMAPLQVQKLESDIRLINERTALAQAQAANEKAKKGELKPMNMHEAGAFVGAMQGAEQVEEVVGRLFDQNTGKVKDPKLMMQMANKLWGTEGRELHSRLASAYSLILFLRSGQAVTMGEAARQLDAYWPSMFDNDATKLSKLNQLHQFFNGMLIARDPTGAYRQAITQQGIAPLPNAFVESPHMQPTAINRTPIAAPAGTTLTPTAPQPTIMIPQKDGKPDVRGLMDRLINQWPEATEDELVEMMKRDYGATDDMLDTLR